MALFAMHGDVETAYGLEGDGPPLLLLHGSGADHRMFDAIAPILVEHFTVIRYDQRDCGETRSPEFAASLTQLAEDANALLLELGFERAHVFGSSFGGRIAQAFALKYPQQVDKLVLGSTWPLPASLGDLHPEGLKELLELRQSLPASSAALARLFYPDSFLASRPDLLRSFDHPQPHSARSLRRATAVAGSLDISISHILAKTLLIAGNADRIVPPGITLAMSSQLRDSRTLLLPGVGHVACVQAPGEVAREILRFIDGRESGFDTDGAE